MGGYRKKTVDLPLKIILTEDGVNFFIKNKKKLNRFKTADEMQDYGIYVHGFPMYTLQNMLQVNYIAKIETSRTEFMSSRQDLLDFSKLMVYGSLYAKFDFEIFNDIIHSDLIIRWNRLNPSSIIDEHSKINENYLKGVLEKNQDVVHKVKQQILKPIYNTINSNKNLQADEKNVQYLLCEKYLDKLRPINWFILSRFSDSPDYAPLLGKIRERLFSYMEKSKIAEYMALMVLELLGNAENTNLHTYAKRAYKGKIEPQRLLYDSELRGKLLKELEENDENLYLSWKLRNSKNTDTNFHKLEVTIYNKESGYTELRERVNDKKTLDIKEKSLMEFYKELPDNHVNSELGLYYLSYLGDACKKVNIRFESSVHQITRSDLTVLSLQLNL